MIAPAIVGPRGRAWRGEDFPKPAEPWRPDWDANCGMWLINVPGCHPFWSWWIVSAVHLRPIEGVKPARLQRPTSTHELMILALNPECGEPDPNDYHAWVDRQRAEKRAHFMTPADLSHQVDAATDEMVTEVCRLLVKAFCDGGSGPDQDYRGLNAQLIDGTLAHMRDGKHIPS